MRVDAAVDAQYQNILAKVRTDRKSFTLRDGLQGSVRQHLLREAHDAPLSGHLGRDIRIRAPFQIPLAQNASGCRAVGTFPLARHVSQSSKPS